MTFTKGVHNYRLVHLPPLQGVKRIPFIKKYEKYSQNNTIHSTHPGECYTCFFVWTKGGHPHGVGPGEGSNPDQPQSQDTFV